MWNTAKYHEGNAVLRKEHQNRASFSILLSMSLINYVIYDKFISVEQLNASLMQESNYPAPPSLEMSISNPSVFLAFSSLVF